MPFVMKATHNWLSFKSLIDQHVLEGKQYLFRGQSQDNWGLVSTYHRLVNPRTPSVYWDLLVVVQDYVSTWTGKRWDLTNDYELASFLGFLQHNGFPTPLLDWTLSPYAAAYFAFAGVDDAHPKSDNVAIFILDSVAWTRDWTQVYDVRSDIDHVSILTSHSMGNQKQLLQQGSYTFSTVPNQELHLRAYEQRRVRSGRERASYLQKATISVHEKPMAMRDLGLMGICAMNLFPGVEGVCRHLRETLFPAPALGATPTQAFLKMLEDRKTLDKALGPKDTPGKPESADASPQDGNDNGSAPEPALSEED